MAGSMQFKAMRSSRGFSSAMACKFGGTSMATPDSWKTVKGIMDSEPNRKFMVVSAPGRRFKDDIKTTDLLIKLTETPTGDERKELADEIKSRFMQILDSFGSSSAGFQTKWETLYPQLLASENSDFIVSRGEYLSAATVADAFDYEFIEPSENVFLQKGAIDYDKTLSSLAATLKALPSGKKCVMPGFFGFDTVTNEVGVLPRGGSDISGALLAQAGGASVYENWTDVDGVYTADPNRIDGALKLESLSFEELRALGNNGAQVLHPATLGNPEASAASVLNFPIHLRNTFAKPLVDGTMIAPDANSPIRMLGVVMGETSLKLVGTPGPGSKTERKYVKEACKDKLRAGLYKDPKMAGDSAWLEVILDPNCNTCPYEDRFNDGVSAAARTLHNVLTDKGWFSGF
jgi:aspartate kinase